MSKRKVRKTDLLNQKKRSLLQVRYGLDLQDAYELQLGYTVELPEMLAYQLVQAGLVTYVIDTQVIATTTMDVDIQILESHRDFLTL